jgi:hypothetical protein
LGDVRTILATVHEEAHRWDIHHRDLFGRLVVQVLTLLHDIDLCHRFHQKIKDTPLSLHTTDTPTSAHLSFTTGTRSPPKMVTVVMMAIFEAMSRNQTQIGRALALNRRSGRDTLSPKGRFALWFLL